MLITTELDLRLELADPQSTYGAMLEHECFTYVAQIPYLLLPGHIVHSNPAGSRLEVDWSRWELSSSRQVVGFKHVKAIDRRHYEQIKADLFRAGWVLDE